MGSLQRNLLILVLPKPGHFVFCKTLSFFSLAHKITWVKIQKRAKPNSYKFGDQPLPGSAFEGYIRLGWVEDL